MELAALLVVLVPLLEVVSVQRLLMFLDLIDKVHCLYPLLCSRRPTSSALAYLPRTVPLAAVALPSRCPHFLCRCYSSLGFLREQAVQGQVLLAVCPCQELRARPLEPHWDHLKPCQHWEQIYRLFV